MYGSMQQKYNLTVVCDRNTIAQWCVTKIKIYSGVQQKQAFTYSGVQQK